MARDDQSSVSDDMNSYGLDYLMENSQFMNDQYIYHPQLISESHLWASHPANMSPQMLDQQSTPNMQYDDLQQIDPALWQYDGEYPLDPRQMPGPSHQPQGQPVIDPLLRSISQHEMNNPNIMPPHSRNNSIGHQRNPSISSERPTPARQAPSQTFVIPITKQDHHVNSYPDSNAMFCDFPGVAFRSFLPKDATTPTSLPANTYEYVRGSRRTQKSDARKNLMSEGPPPAQIYGPYQPRISSGPAQGSSQSPPYASGSTGFETTDNR